MRQLFLIAVLFVFAITTAFVTNSINENPDPRIKGIPLSADEVRILMSGDLAAQSRLASRLINAPTDTGGDVDALIIVCYGGSASAPDSTCFGIWGTDSCSDVNCSSGCWCYDDL